MLIEFSPELLAGVVGAAISWLFKWFPGLRTWYAALKSEVKSGIMLGLLALTTVVIYLLVLNGVLMVSEPLTWWRVLTVLFAATVLNQTTYTAIPPAKDAKAAKEKRDLLTK
jgi:hypothetical protein